jgi:hypothetical protein
MRIAKVEKLQGEPKNRTFVFLGENFLKIFHQKTQQYGFLAHPVWYNPIVV